MSALDDIRAQYVETRTHAQYLAVADLGAVVVPVFQTLFAFADYAVGHPAVYPYMIAGRATTVALCLCYPFVKRRSELAARGYMLAIFALYVMWTMLLIPFAIQIGFGDRIVIPMINSLTTCLAAAACLPFSSRVTGYLTLATTAFLTFCLRDHLDTASRFIVVHFFGMFGITTLKSLDAAEIRDIALRELATRLRTAPLDLVRRSMLQGSESLEDSLRMRTRSVVCIASDWRGYQAISRDFKPDTIASALGAYYDACRALLSQHFPDGAYYCDWIADELMVVVLVEDGAEAAAARTSLTFAKALLELKKSFLAEHGLPRGIDVGIAAGRSTVGLCGPKANPKMMAIGAVPIVARRLQLKGKLLRGTAGDQDRIFFDDAFAELAGTEGTRQGGSRFVA